MVGEINRLGCNYGSSRQRCDEQTYRTCAQDSETHRRCSALKGSQTERYTRIDGRCFSDMMTKVRDVADLLDASHICDACDAITAMECVRR
jgi:hypothetical protein